MNVVARNCNDKGYFKPKKADPLTLFRNNFSVPQNQHYEIFQSMDGIGNIEDIGELYERYQRQV